MAVAKVASLSFRKDTHAEVNGVADGGGNERDRTWAVGDFPAWFLVSITGHCVGSDADAGVCGRRQQGSAWRVAEWSRSKEPVLSQGLGRTFGYSGFEQLRC